MSEHQPGPSPENPVSGQGVNSYGTDDPIRQAEIEQARAEAMRERRRNRERLEQLVETGMSPDDAEALIEFEDSQLEQGEQEGREPPRIYVASLADYNDGEIVGEWIDASQTAENIHREIQHILDRSPSALATGIPAGEWAIHDYDGFGSVQLDEYVSLEYVAALGQGIARHGLAFAAWASIHDEQEPAALERFSDHYQGSYDSRADYAEQHVQALGVDSELFADAPEWLQPFIRIDDSGLVRDMELSGIVKFVERGDGGVWAFDVPA